MPPKTAAADRTLFVFQQIYEFAQPTLVTTISDRNGKWRLQPPAQPAASFARLTYKGIRTELPLATDGANATRDRAYVDHALRAD